MKPGSQRDIRMTARLARTRPTQVYRSVYSRRAPGQWQVYVVNEVPDWIDTLDAATHQSRDSITLVAGDKTGRWTQ